MGLSAQQAHGRTRRGEGFPRIVALVVGVGMGAAGLWAFAAPASFFAAAATFEPYNVHFVRDLGAFQLGLGAVLILAAVMRDTLLVALAGVAVGAVFHLVGHVIDVDLGGDPVMDIPAFGLVALLLAAAAVARAASLRR